MLSGQYLSLSFAFFIQVTFTTKRSSAYVDVYGQDAGETYVIFNTTSSVNISKYVRVALSVICYMKKTYTWHEPFPVVTTQ
jgi:hypothetical protein